NPVYSECGNCRLCQLAKRLGLKDHYYFIKYFYGVWAYDEVGSDEKYEEVYLDPCECNLEGMDFAYFTAKLFYAEGFNGKYASPENTSNHIEYTYTGSSEYSETTVYKDINYDGVYNIADLAHLKAYISGIEDRVNFIAADRDGNGAVNLADISEFKAALAG
ncbi:MAG: dockerin type I repeat-containing protein, partial [Clostridia bacterium]|nr:dockerin type I repeat-containing protein [Clostridia bacterium]